MELFSFARRTKLLFSKMNTWRPTKDVLTPWKWPQDLREGVFVDLPMTLGLGCGIAAGAYEGHQYTREDWFPYSFACTTFGAIYGGIGGCFMGFLWPITLPLLFVRAYYPTTPQDKKT